MFIVYVCVLCVCVCVHHYFRIACLFGVKVYIYSVNGLVSLCIKSTQIPCTWSQNEERKEEEKKHHERKYKFENQKKKSKESI